MRTGCYRDYGVLIAAGIVAFLAGSRTVFWILVLSLIATVIGQTSSPSAPRPRGQERVLFWPGGGCRRNWRSNVDDFPDEDDD